MRTVPHPYFRSLMALSLLLALAAAAPAQSVQSVLQGGDIGIVTSTGFWRLRANLAGFAPVNHVPASAFGGLAQLQGAAIGWEPGSDSFLVAAGTSVYRVRILSTTTQSVTDLAPQLGGFAQLHDLDIHPGSGALYVRDALTEQVFRFAPPFAPGMTPDLVLPTGPGIAAAAVDSRDNPPSVLVATGTVVRRLPLDGSPAIDVAFEGAVGLDGHPQARNRTLIANRTKNLVDATSDSPMLAQNLNVVGLCAPVVLGPSSVAWNPIDKRAYVFASDGLNPVCFPGGSSINQVVSLPSALSPFVQPEILTNPFDSGITGTDGALTLVLPDFAFPAPYGFGATSPTSGKVFALDCNDAPFLGNTGFELELTHGPPSQPVFLLVGVQPIELALPGGGTALVPLGYSPLVVGTTSAKGKLTVPAPLGTNLPAGFSAYVQAMALDAGHVLPSNALQLHFAP
ncbi:MAG TPA: hypothetical protein VK824_08620 [Planctomycetota bacterium]|nr:hypothetical protein [Planctomycetota bacterium]